MFGSGSVRAPVGPDPLLLLSTCGGFSGKCSTSHWEWCGSTRIRRKMRPRRSKSASECGFSVNFEFSPKQPLKSEFERTITFSTACNSSRDRHHSIDQNLDYSKKIGRAKVTHRIARKSRKCVKKTCLVRVRLGRQLALTRYYS